MKILLSVLALVATYIPASAQLLYKITNPEGTNISYIFGTHHMAPLSVLDDIPQIQQALDNAEVVVGEIDMTGGQMQMALQLQKYAAAPPDSTLSSLYSSADYDRLDAAFTKFIDTPPLSLKMFDSMRPMVVQALFTVYLMQKHFPEYDPSQQLDTYFQTESKALGKDIIALETVDEQGNLLYQSTPIAQQADNLLKIIDNPEEAVQEVKELNESYLSHDIQALLDMTIAQEDDAEAKQFINVLLTQRNHNWMEKLPEILNSRPAFVAVGALHLPGENGILNLLQRKGFSITPVDAITGR
ncbi:MAG: TraB/GumN family protein [Muribaculum sp.]|nr:TraB/GumN family protein [Muribaculum sp.]